MRLTDQLQPLSSSAWLCPATLYKRNVMEEHAGHHQGALQPGAFAVKQQEGDTSGRQQVRGESIKSDAGHRSDTYLTTLHPIINRSRSQFRQMVCGPTGCHEKPLPRLWHSCETCIFATHFPSVLPRLRLQSGRHYASTTRLFEGEITEAPARHYCRAHQLASDDTHTARTTYTLSNENACGLRFGCEIFRP